MGTDPRLQKVIGQLRVQFPTAWTGTLRELLERVTAQTVESRMEQNTSDSANGDRNE